MIITILQHNMIASLNNCFKHSSQLLLNFSSHCIFCRHASFHRVPKRIISKTKNVGANKVSGESRMDTEASSFRKNDTDDVLTLDSENGVLKYEKGKGADKKFLSMITAAKSSKLREKKNMILLEGKRLIRDAIDAKVQIKSIFFSQKEALEGLDLSLVEDVKIYKIFHKQMAVWSDLTTPPGIIAICKKPDIQVQENGNCLPVIIICDNIRDPGNLGAIIRTACAAGCKFVLTTAGCVDTWNSKVIRGGAGAHFRIPIYSSIRWPYIRNYLPEAFNMIIADNNSDKEHRFNVNSALLPDQNSNEIQVEPSGLIRDDSYTNKETLKFYENILLPHEYYPDLKISTENETVLTIGGETEGVSLSAHKLAYDFEGKKVTIPLLNGMESLNTAAATAVILFELRRMYGSRLSI